MADPKATPEKTTTPDKSTSSAPTSRERGRDDNAPESATTAAEVREDVREQAKTQRSTYAPYPAYDVMDIDELRGHASSQGVGIPADVEKALLIGQLRKRLDVEENTGGTVEVDSPSDPLPSLDLMRVEDLRSLAKQNEVEIPEGVERGYLVGQLRAVTSGATAAQSAQVGSAAPVDADASVSGGVENATPKVLDKDSGRG